MHHWFLVCCIIDNINVEVKCGDLDRTALVGTVWDTRAVWSVSTQLDYSALKMKNPISLYLIDRELLKDY